MEHAVLTNSATAGDYVVLASRPESILFNTYQRSFVSRTCSLQYLPHSGRLDQRRLRSTATRTEEVRRPRMGSGGPWVWTSNRSARCCPLLYLMVYLCWRPYTPSESGDVDLGFGRQGGTPKAVCRNCLRYVLPFTSLGEGKGECEVDGTGVRK